MEMVTNVLHLSTYKHKTIIMARESRNKFIVDGVIYSANEAEFYRWAKDLSMGIEIANDVSEYFSKVANPPTGHMVYVVDVKEIKKTTKLTDLKSYEFNRG